MSSFSDWALALIAETGSEAHLEKLEVVNGKVISLYENGGFPTEAAFYRKFGLAYIAPELREGHDEIERAQQGTLPSLVTLKDIRGELHAHSTSSDGSHSIEQMAIAARDLGYQYIGITDNSQSLKIARGVTVEDVWKQIRFIDKLNDKLNSRLTGIRVLKSAEVDILADGALDYPDEVLAELDYTVCSVHSRFGFGKQQQTERILRAVDNRYFNILGHATGRLLLKRAGYALDMDRIIHHANRTDASLRSIPVRTDWTCQQRMRVSRMKQVKRLPSPPRRTARANSAQYGTASIRPGEPDSNRPRF